MPSFFIETFFSCRWVCVYRGNGWEGLLTPSLLQWTFACIIFSSKTDWKYVFYHTLSPEVHLKFIGNRKSSLPTYPNVTARNTKVEFFRLVHSSDVLWIIILLILILLSSSIIIITMSTVSFRLFFINFSCLNFVCRLVLSCFFSVLEKLVWYLEEFEFQHYR